jgi:hypothetical protein
MDTIRFPLRFDETNGGMVFLDEGTDDYYRQLLSIAARTEQGTHPVIPDFGVMDPTFKTIDRGQFLLSAAHYVPEIQVTSVETLLDEGSGENAITFSFMQRSGS